MERQNNEIKGLDRFNLSEENVLYVSGRAFYDLKAVRDAIPGSHFVPEKKAVAIPVLGREGSADNLSDTLQQVKDFIDQRVAQANSERAGDGDSIARDNKLLLFDLSSEDVENFNSLSSSGRQTITLYKNNNSDYPSHAVNLYHDPSIIIDRCEESNLLENCFVKEENIALQVFGKDNLQALFDLKIPGVYYDARGGEGHGIWCIPVTQEAVEKLESAPAFSGLTKEEKNVRREKEAVLSESLDKSKKVFLDVPFNKGGQFRLAMEKVNLKVEEKQYGFDPLEKKYFVRDSVYKNKAKAILDDLEIKAVEPDFVGNNRIDYQGYYTKMLQEKGVPLGKDGVRLDGVTHSHGNYSYIFSNMYSDNKSNENAASGIIVGCLTHKNQDGRLDRTVLLPPDIREGGFYQKQIIDNVKKRQNELRNDFNKFYDATRDAKRIFENGFSKGGEPSRIEFDNANIFNAVGLDSEVVNIVLDNLDVRQTVREMDALDGVAPQFKDVFMVPVQSLDGDFRSINYFDMSGDSWYAKGVPLENCCSFLNCDNANDLSNIVVCRDIFSGLAALEANPDLEVVVSYYRDPLPLVQELRNRNPEAEITVLATEFDGQSNKKDFNLDCVNYTKETMPDISVKTINLSQVVSPEHMDKIDKITRIVNAVKEKVIEFDLGNKENMEVYQQAKPKQQDASMGM